MRIIAGEFRGRKLISPPGDQTRPVTDRVKQSLFDIVSTAIPGALVYDCFAGTGSFGLESVSRGAEMAVFFERNKQVLAALRQNIRILGVENRSVVVGGDVFSLVAELPIRQRPADVVFLDPPYRMVREESNRLMELASDLATAHMSPGAILIFRHDAMDRLELPPFAKYDERSYGGMLIEFLRANRE